VYVENHNVYHLDPKDPIHVSYGKKIGDEPTGKEHPELLKMGLSLGHDGTIIDGISRIGFMTGGQAARWKDEDKADVLTGKAVDFIQQNASHPFFLEFATHDPHVPRVPNARFVGKSGLGPRGDAIVEFDWSVGQVLAKLDELHLATNTIVILSSDNGPVLDDGYDDRAVEDLNGHTPAGPLRGGKYSVYEGGTRVPFLVRWSGHVTPGVSDALVSLVDFSASFAALTGEKIPAGQAPDSVTVLPALLGQSQVGRDKLVEHDGARVFGFRDGLWKYIEPDLRARHEYSPDGELYDLANDLGETNDLHAAKPETDGKLAGELKLARAQSQTKTNGVPVTTVP
jgi:arylsulfatase A-like enzyme